MNKKVNKITIATGGTGGHIFPAYSLAKHFIKKKIDVKITSDKRGLKYLPKEYHLKTIQIPSTTIYKKNIFQIFLSILIIFYALIRALFFLASNRSDLVFGMGGYSSFPTCIAAKILKIPFIIYENNLHIGKANRYLLRYAEKVFVSFKELEGIQEKFQKKTFQIGNIIREEILSFEKKFNNSITLFNHFND